MLDLVDYIQLKRGCMEHDQQKQRSIYMRFHVTLQKAMSFAKSIYAQRLVPHNQNSGVLAQHTDLRADRVDRVAGLPRLPPHLAHRHPQGHPQHQPRGLPGGDRQRPQRTPAERGREGEEVHRATDPQQALAAWVADEGDGGAGGGDGGGAVLHPHLLPVLLLPDVGGVPLGEGGGRLRGLPGLRLPLLVQGHLQTPTDRQEHQGLHQELLQEDRRTTRRHELHQAEGREALQLPLTHPPTLYNPTLIQSHHSYHTSCVELGLQGTLRDLPQSVPVLLCDLRVHFGRGAVCVVSAALHLVRQESVHCGLVALGGTLAEEPPNGEEDLQGHLRKLALEAIGLDLPHELSPHHAWVQTGRQSTFSYPFREGLSEEDVVQFGAGVGHIGIVVLVEVYVFPVRLGLSPEPYKSLVGE